jgi:hypothetical protein
MTSDDNISAAMQFPLTLSEQWGAAKLGSTARRRALPRDQASTMLEMQYSTTPARAQAARYFWPAYEGGTMPALGATWPEPRSPGRAQSHD